MHKVLKPLIRYGKETIFTFLILTICFVVFIILTVLFALLVLLKHIDQTL